MFKRFTTLCFALTVVLALPFVMGCAGRPPAPQIDKAGETHGLGEDSEERTVEHDGEDVPVSDAMLPIN